MCGWIRIGYDLWSACVQSLMETTGLLRCDWVEEGGPQIASLGYGGLGLGDQERRKAILMLSMGAQKANFANPCFPTSYPQSA